MLKLLLVDDSVQNLDMLEMIFEGSDYERYSATTADAGFDLLQLHGCQIAVIDWMMPDVTGLDMVKRIRREVTDRYVYTILVTAQGGTTSMFEGLESGVDDFLRRPFSPRELRARVKIGERIIATQEALIQSQRAIQQAKQEWEATTDAVTELICLLDGYGRIRRANQTYEEWGLGWVKDAKGVYLHAALANVYQDFGDFLKQHWPFVQKRLDAGLCYELNAEDKTFGRHFAVHFEPIEQEDSLTDGYAVASISDITQRRNLEIALRSEHQKSEALLLNILPQSISERLKDEEKVIVDEFEQASVLFTDLVGFTAFAATVSPKRLIAILNDIFSRFDALTQAHGLEKIKTIGDAYMVAAGVPLARDDHAQAAVALGLDMVKAVVDFNTSTGLIFGIRVGVHSGPLVAGVIGIHKFAYDLWGDTVNIASRMESTGEPGAVHISTTTADLLPAEFILAKRNPVYVKGRGQMQTYFVTRAIEVSDNA
jgi:class 3 adenylate cyclase/CheY-like chemotaxis protein